jgi:replication fork protection complex subunit Tof1/Swi1
MKEASILELLSTLVANAHDSLCNPYNALLMEIYYLLFRSVKPAELTVDLSVSAPVLCDSVYL